MTFAVRGLGTYIKPMKQSVLAILCLCLAAPAYAEDEGKSLMEQGMELFFEGLREEMAPTLESFRDLAEEFGPSMAEFFAEMGPALTELMEEVQDWSAYHPPEILPNGDIIIRRKTEDELADPDEDAEVPPDGSTEI